MSQYDEESCSAGGVVRDVLLIVGGAMIGAAAALLYAPQTGERTRRMLSRQAEDMLDQAKDVGDDVMDKLNDMRDNVAKQVNEGTEYVGDQKDAFLKKLHVMQDKLSGIISKVSKS